MLELTEISPSKIKSFDMCKFKFWLTYYCPDVELKSNWGAQHGTLIHHILENYAGERDLDWMQQLYNGYRGFLKIRDKHNNEVLFHSPLKLAKAKYYKDVVPYCDTCPFKEKDSCYISGEKLNNLSGCPKKLFETSISMLQNSIERYTNIWDNILRDEKNNIIGTEYKFRIPIDNVSMVGVIDLVVKEDESTIHIYDYKTGVFTQNYEECANDIQVRMYSLAARKEFIENPNYKFKNVILTFDYFTKSPITLAFSKEEDDRTEAFVKNKINEIKNTRWITRIKPTNGDFSWKCKALCDINVCANKWNGVFET